MRPFRQVDVFTDTLTLGNPVAVVHDADGLSTEQMASLARWTNLSETTFLLPPTDARADYHLRIFTPGRELPFAGHPTLGSARAWLEAGGSPKAEYVVQECEAGLVPIRRTTGTRLAFAAPPLLRSGAVDPEDFARIAHTLRIGSEEILASQWADNGPGWIAVLLEDAAAVRAIELDPARPGDLKIGVVGRCGEDEDADFEVRAFAADVGNGEDPVTGSLNASIAQWLIGSGQAPDSYVAAQGSRLHRRGRVYIERQGGDIWVGGDTVIGVVGSVSI